MRSILFLIPTLGHGGAEKVLVNLVNNMDTSKFDITIQTLFDEGVHKKSIHGSIRYKSFLKKQFHGNTTLFSLIPAKLLYRVIVREKYDYIVSYLEGPTTHIIAGCPYNETKKIAWVHIELGDSAKFKQGFRTKREAVKAYESFDKIVGVSETVKNVFEETAGKPFPNMTVLYNTIETTQIIEKAKDPIEDVVFSTECVNVCSVAKLMESKGFDRLVRVHKRLLDEGFRHRIYILGEGEKKAELEEYIKDNNLNKSFILLGFRENPYKYVAACDLYVCSSRREGFSTAVTEALIVGTPVVSTLCSGAEELLGKNDEYGIVVENSEDGIYTGLRQMLQSKALRKKYAEKALERGRNFSTEKTVLAVEELLRDV